MKICVGRSVSASPCKKADLQSPFQRETPCEAAHWMMRMKVLLASTGASRLSRANAGPGNPALRCGSLA